MVVEDRDCGSAWGPDADRRGKLLTWHLLWGSRTGACPQPSAETAAMLFWALMASGQITMRKVDGWQTFGEKLADPVLVDLAA